MESSDSGDCEEQDILRRLHGPPKQSDFGNCYCTNLESLYMHVGHQDIC